MYLAIVVLLTPTPAKRTVCDTAVASSFPLRTGSTHSLNSNKAGAGTKRKHPLVSNQTATGFFVCVFWVKCVV